MLLLRMGSLEAVVRSDDLRELEASKDARMIGSKVRKTIFLIRCGTLFWGWVALVTSEEVESSEATVRYVGVGYVFLKRGRVNLRRLRQYI
jgi:hypothetical protein